MFNFITSLSVTTYIALYGAILSSIAIYLNYRYFRIDRAKLKLRGMIAMAHPDPTNRTYLVFIITNIGRRVAIAEGLAYKEKIRVKKQGIVITNSLPKKLNEGDSITERFDNFEAIKDKPWSFYVYDSTGKQYKMKRKDLKRLYKDYDKHLLNLNENDK